MSFNTDLLPDQYDAIIVSSDEEPDDLLAKYIISKFTASLPTLWITGEGKESKLQLARDQAACLDVNCKIIQGQLSHRKYPSSMLKAFTLAGEQKTFGEADLLEFLTQYKNPLFIMLKPCWELFDLPTDLLSKVTLAAYGSFNFRCLLKSFSISFLSVFFSTMFKRVVLYETFFAIGADNTINLENASGIFARIYCKASQGDPFWQGVQSSIKIWNNHILESCLAKLEKNAATMKEEWKTELESGKAIDWKKREEQLQLLTNQELKIINNIVSKQGQQMVLADFGLAVLLFQIGKPALQTNSIARGNITFHETLQYTQFSECTEGKVFLIRDVCKVALIKAIKNTIE